MTIAIATSPNADITPKMVAKSMLPPPMGLLGLLA
jgi:hypothetical protein